MTRIRTWYVDLASAFPADRPIAGLMAQLMVLWADGLLEFNSIGTEEEGKGSRFEALDILDPIYRRIYFWRGLTITLSSAKDLFDALMRDQEFVGWLDAAPEMKERFINDRRTFNRLYSRVSKIRNRVAAHVEKDVRQAPANITPGRRGFLDWGGGDVMRPRLASEFILATVLHADNQTEPPELEKILREVREAFNAMVRLMVDAVNLYSEHYPLFRSR